MVQSKQTLLNLLKEFKDVSASTYASDAWIRSTTDHALIQHQGRNQARETSLTKLPT